MTPEKKTSPEKDAAAKKPARKPAAKKAEGRTTPGAKKPAADTAAKKKAPARKSAPSAKAPAKKPEPKPEKAAETRPAPRRKPKEEAPAAPVVRASARYVRVAPRKARLIADQVRGLQIERARALLAFSPRSAARDIHKLIDSAASNAENNHDLVADEMRVSEITVDEGPTLRRFRARALGRATRINKRTSHISVALTPGDES
jgi:ribosomal protein L22